ncbi:hypothetical protein BKA61DRAFT_683246 [Leptodontidium sp. MPI-SDFR-AT-0119]|nr:hypothetical protein BKA61DRAFT_683246 [Leptodontidium sp. MPI-SDFR-AT-0119]
MDTSPFILPNGPSPLTTFHCFNNLPLELRLYIWYLCLPGPRIHRIGWTSPELTSRSSCISPVIMFVCHEARNESLHHLKELSLPSVFLGRPSPTPTGCRSRCYFNPAIDTLFLAGPSHPSQSMSPWLRSWVEGKGLENTDFSLVREIAVDREWLDPISPLSRLMMPVGELVRLLGHVEVVHVVSLNSHWSMRPWAMWREIGRVPDNMRPEFTWVDMEEVKKRPTGGYACIWSDWGDNAEMARAGTDILSLDGVDARARLGEVVQKLKDERVMYPSEWTMPKVRLDFVRYNRVKREEKWVLEKKKGAFGMGGIGAMLPILSPVGIFKKWVGRS